MKSTKLIILLLVANILSGAPTFAQSPTESSSNGKVRGSIYDPTGDAVIPGMKVVIEGEGIKRTITTNENGEYEFDLPAGIYNITTEQGWYYPLKRASFRVHTNATSVINLYPAIRMLSIALEVTRSGIREPVTYAKPPKYNSFSSAQSSPLNLVIGFDKKKVRRGIIEYKYAKLSYDARTVSAEILLFDEKNSRIEAKGNVLIDNNGQRRRVNNVGIDLRTGVPDILSRLGVTNYGEPNNLFNRSANSATFMRETLLLWRFVAPG